MYSCSICLTSLALPPSPRNECDNEGPDDLDNKIVATPCGHVFHDFCIRQWMSNQYSEGDESLYARNGVNCPYCRKKFRSLTQIFLNNDDSRSESGQESSAGGGSQRSHRSEVAGLRAELEEKEKAIVAERAVNYRIKHRMESCERKLNYQLAVSNELQCEVGRLRQLLRSAGVEKEHLCNEVRMVTRRNERLLEELHEQENKQQMSKGRRRNSIPPRPIPNPPGTPRTPPAQNNIKVAKMSTGGSPFQPVPAQRPNSGRSLRCYPSEIPSGRCVPTYHLPPTLYPEVGVLSSTVLRPNVNPPVSSGNFLHYNLRSRPASRKTYN